MNRENAPVVRFRDEDTDGQNVETFYYANDANFNVTALVDTSGAVVERYTYTLYVVSVSGTIKPSA